MLHRTPFFLPLVYPKLQWRVPTNAKELYLTFDDGPVPGPTEFVLDQLSKFSAKATFFCIGNNVDKHPDVFDKIVKADHAIGNHTYHHLNGWKTPCEEYVQNIEKCNQLLTNTPQSTNLRSENKKLFRPPYGRITRSQIKHLEKYNIVMWDVLSIDYNKNISPDSCLRNTIQASRPGSIIVFHDSVKAERNMMYALPRFLQHFTADGFVFKSLPG